MLARQFSLAGMGMLLRGLMSLGALISLGFFSVAVSAQSWPARPIQLLQPLGVGSPGDIVSRAIAQSLSQSFGQSMVVENKVGANGILGMEACARAPADGYTVCVPSFSQMTMNPVLYSKLPYDPLKDFAPVVLIGAINSSIVVHVSVPVNSVRELIDYAKTRPGALNWGSWGVGSFPHLYMAWLQSVSATSYTHVPYKSIGQAVTAVAAGEVQVLLNTPGLMAPLVKAGKIRALAVVGHRRSPHMDVPTLKEAGFEPPIISWVGVTLPVGTPREVVMRYNGEINKLLADTKFVERVLWPVSIDVVGGTPEEFAAFLKKDRELTERVAKLAEIKRE